MKILGLTILWISIKKIKESVKVKTTDKVDK